MKKNIYECIVCKKSFVLRDTISANLVREPIYTYIQKDYPNWKQESYICRADLSVYRNNYVHQILASEKGCLTSGGLSSSYFSTLAPFGLFLIFSLIRS